MTQLVDSSATQKRLAEFAARDQFGRLVGFLSAQTRSIHEAEDALADALIAALDQWPRTGVPDNPSAWLLRVARNKLVDNARKRTVRRDTDDILIQLTEERLLNMETHSEYLDDRLSLMFACTHPAIDQKVQAPLILQTVLGFDAKSIAQSMLVSPNTLGQRLARVKNKIKQSGIPFQIPPADQHDGRLQAVLDAIYACFTIGWKQRHTNDNASTWIREATFLASIVHQLNPTHSETLGLYSMLLFIESRSNPDTLNSTDFLPLYKQDTSHWDTELIDKADALLKEASQLRMPGRFQIEAAIQSVHCDRKRTGITAWHAVLSLYDALKQLSPTIGGIVAQAGAMLCAGKKQAASKLLDELDSSFNASLVSEYQPYWVVSAELAHLQGDGQRFLEHMSIAIGLTVDPAQKQYLIKRRQQFMQ